MPRTYASEFPDFTTTDIPAEFLYVRRAKEMHAIGLRDLRSGAAK